MTDEVKNLGEPITLEQLRGMDGEPVLLVFDFEPEPMISLIEYAQDDDCIILTNNLGGRSEFYSDEELREYGIKVYVYRPVATDTNVGGKDINVPTSINLDAWEPCEECKTCRNCKNYDDYDPYEGTTGECGQCYNMSNFEPVNFCHDCGKPLTEEARAMLEKRLRGCFE